MPAAALMMVRASVVAFGHFESDCGRRRKRIDASLHCGQLTGHERRGPIIG